MGQVSPLSPFPVAWFPLIQGLLVSGMKDIWVLLFWLISFGVVVSSANVSLRPAVVNIGAILTFDSTIGRVAKIAIEEAVKDVNANSNVLNGTQLVVRAKDTNCSGFLGMMEALQFMENDVVAMIGPQSSTVAHAILHVANELKTPFLSFAATDPTLSSLQFPYFIRTTQSDLHQMTAVAEMVYHYGWKEVIVIFLDDDYGRNGLSALVNALAVKRCRVSNKAGIPPGGITRTDIMDILVNVALKESRIIVVHAYPEVGNMIFSVAKYLGMMEDGYVWIATDWLSSTLDSVPAQHLESLTDTMQGVLVLRQHVPGSERKNAFLARWNKLTGGSIRLSTYGLQAYDTVWLLAHAMDSFLNQGGVISFSNDSRLESLQINSLQLNGMVIFDGGELLLKNILESDFVGLAGPVKFGVDKSLVFPSYEIINVIGTGLHRIGYWSNHTGLSLVAPETLYAGAPNRSIANQLLSSVVWPGESIRTPRGWVFPNNGKLLRIGVPRRVSYQEFVSQVPGTNNSKGFCIDVFIAAINLLPYAVPYQFIPYGNGLENPSYNELVKLITSGFFDGAVGDIAIVKGRTKMVDFTQPYAASGLVVLAPVEDRDPTAWAFLRPFSHRLWGVTAAFFLFIGLVVWILEHRFNDEFRGPPKKQLITILWFSLSTLFFAHRENIVSTLGRLVMIIWLFVVLIINSSYTASLTSILTVQQLHSPIKGIASLKDGDDPIGYQIGSFSEHYLIDNIGIPKSRLKALGSPEEYATALQLGPKAGGVAAIVDELPYIQLYLSSQCKFRIIGSEFTKGGWGFAFPRDSSLAIDLSTAILTLSENGDLQRINDKWLVKTACALDNTELDSSQLRLRSFWGLFLLSGITCFLALLAYFAQVVYKFRKAESPNSSVSDTSAAMSDVQPSSSRSRKFQTLLSIIDEKTKDRPTRENKRRKFDERSLSENIVVEIVPERDSSRKHSQSQSLSSLSFNSS